MKIRPYQLLLCFSLLAVTFNLAIAEEKTEEKPPITEDLVNLKLGDWKPKSMMVTKKTIVKKSMFPSIDVHNHLGRGAEFLTKERVQGYLKEMDAAGVETVVNLDGQWGDALEETLTALDNAHPGRFLTYALINFDGIEDPTWTQREVGRLRASFESGAKGLKLHKSLGLIHKYANGKIVPVDDPKLDPLWEVCAEYKRPVMIHTSDPRAFFTPLDSHNERWHELGNNPHWSYAGEEFPTRTELLEQRNRMIAKHPNTQYIGAHFANAPEDLESVGKWLDKYPNLMIDIDARISELGRQPYSARKFIIKYQDRIMFGTDTSPKALAFRLYFRFLETDDEYWNPTEGHHQQGFWNIYGIFLPKDVLEKVYRTNAQKTLFGLPKK